MAGAKVTLDTAEFNRKFNKLTKHVEDVSPMLLAMGEILVNSTKDRFDSGVDVTDTPFVPLSPLTKKRKKKNKDKILVKSGALSKLTYQLVNGGLEFGSDSKYAAIHQFGSGDLARPKNIPARPFIGLTQKDESEILNMVVDHLEGAFD